MFVPPVFASPDDGTTRRLIEDNPFGLLVASGGAGVVAAHLPMDLDAGRNVLVGHLARPNHVVPALQDCARAGSEVMAVFQGPHGYVSPDWYAAKRNTVPTWNYAAAHVYGVPTVFDDKKRLHVLVEALSRRHARGVWTLAGQDGDFIDRMLGGIVGFELAVTRIEGKFKLSQNRQAADRAGVVAGLDATGRAADRELADLMRAHSPKG